MPDLSKLSGSKLAELADRLGAAHNAVVRELIAAGHGDKRHSDIAAMADAGDALAIRHQETWAAYSGALDELEARRRYHGSNRPIRRRDA